jgi:hypothetical protein
MGKDFKMKYCCTTIALLSLLAGPLAAGGMSPALIEAASCGEFPVISSVYDDATGVTTLVCGEDAEAFVPLTGGLAGPALGLLGAAFLLGSTGGGGGTSDTQ